MIAVDLDHRVEVVDEMETYEVMPPLALVVQPDSKLYKLLADLSPDTPWGERQIAAKKLGNMRDPEALPGLLDTLPSDQFWMVRCAIIQALEKIGDPRAIPTLREVANSDSFQVVRSYASKAVERLSSHVA
jgi:HEAT repeat protein